ncbi:MAG: helix-turn-helix transcriptional regulator [Bacteroidota bacterium]
MQVHIGKKIREVFDDSGMSISEFGRRIKTTRQNVYGIFKRSSIDTALLVRVGKALNHDFFTYYAETPSAAAEPRTEYARRTRGRKIVLQIEIEDEKQNEILRLALGDNAYEILRKSLK